MSERKRVVGAPRKTARKRTAVGDALRRAREEAGESLAVFAARLGVRPRTLHGWESDGHRPSALALAELARRLPVLAPLVSRA